MTFGGVDGESVTAIYDAYPRKRAPRAAKPAILKALNRIAERPNPPANPTAWLLDRTLAYAKSAEGLPSTDGEDFRRYPATWFNNDAFDESDAEWQKSKRRVGRVPAVPGRYGKPDLVIDQTKPPVKKLF